MRESISRQLEGDCLSEYRGNCHSLLFSYSEHDNSFLPQWIFEGGDNESMAFKSLAPCVNDCDGLLREDIITGIRYFPLGISPSTRSYENEGI